MSDSVLAGYANLIRSALNQHIIANALMESDQYRKIGMATGISRSLID